MRYKPLEPRGAFLGNPAPPAGCLCRRLRRGWDRPAGCPVHGAKVARAAERTVLEMQSEMQSAMDASTVEGKRR